MDSVFAWITQNWVEILASALGLLGIFLQIRQNHWYWLTSIIMVSLYIVVFYNARFYADMSFLFYYLCISIYG
jgi:nicotinamide mononucleotide transporter